jgi:YegS/Rv2252/BmrU family lipid kinase
MYHLFLVNPAAGRTDQTEAVRAAAQALAEALGEPYEVQVSSCRGDLIRLAQEAGKTGRETRIYACGGDGTMNEVVRGAMDFPNLSVTSFACGSGNDFVKQFPNPSAFYDLQNYREVTEQRLDLMQVGENLAVNVCSVGFDARIGTDINAYRHLPLLSGPRAYHASVVVNLVRGVVKPCRVELEDTVVDEDLTMVCVCNGSWYGGSYHPVPEASSTDGLLDVLIVKRVSRLTVARVISAYQKGRYSQFPELISHYRTQSLRIITPEPEPVNLDGELIHSRDTKIQLLPGALRFFGPRTAWKG